ncbi:MAG: uracil-DNA glycosylase family protein [Hydrogenophaga sp.]
MAENSVALDPADTSFVHMLDARQRAMLAEMGVRVWAPKPKPVMSAPAHEMPVAAKPIARPVSAPPRAVEASARAEAVAPRPAPRATPVMPAPERSRSEPPTLKPLPDGVSAMDWATLQTSVAACDACSLCQRRKSSVFGQGDQQADWMVVGEPPSEGEDAQGQPFAGDEGELLDNMLRAVGVSRDKGAFVTTVVKCRPPGNRNPSGEELAHCSAYLARQVALVQPKVIIAMGRLACEVLTQSRDHLGKLRGQVHAFEGVPVIATYHPNALLRTQADKAKAWADLCWAMDLVDKATRA